MNTPIPQIFDTLPPPPESRPTIRAIAPEISAEMFTARIFDLCVGKRRDIVELVMSKEFKEAQKGLVEAVGRDVADDVMSEFFVENKGLFK